ncbi:hypothetical protein WH221_22360 [Chryseobacterium culicis]|uniref:Uncharacterized protein n=1 Tax=Chryseobacterium culicis TaxID=680127 RepID=A0A2S9CHT7_CHRCI|nr:hypothetical protein [Chryseobacterium culicis]PRB80077.1 hypothetical protein CQ022_22285 [Chryseobacterium culicis]PRB87327.1 hypothetical protein CQ033_22290 [Chryseobacterium culicis]
MALTNLNNTHLTDAQLTAAQTALSALETALAVITVTLSAEDRQKYGSINEQNKLLVNKVADYRKNQSALSASEIDWEEFDRDLTSRQNYESFIARLESLVTRLKSAKTLHDYDNYQAALTDYAYTAYKAGTASPGFEVKQNELKQFFTKSLKTDEILPKESK